MNEDLKSRIEGLLKSSRVVVFMKGTPTMPMCGFSASAVQTLRAAGAADFTAIDVLREPEIREGIKEFAGWPTIPQIYVDGKFVGGCDIVRELHDRGELSKLLSGEGS